MDTRIPWPVDMRGWERVGTFADLEIWAKDSRRRLIEPGGPIYRSYEIKSMKIGQVLCHLHPE